MRKSSHAPSPAPEDEEPLLSETPPTPPPRAQTLPPGFAPDGQRSSKKIRSRSSYFSENALTGDDDLFTSWHRARDPKTGTVTGTLTDTLRSQKARAKPTLSQIFNEDVSDEREGGTAPGQTEDLDPALDREFVMQKYFEHMRKMDAERGTPESGATSSRDRVSQHVDNVLPSTRGDAGPPPTGGGQRERTATQDTTGTDTSAVAARATEDMGTDAGHTDEGSIFSQLGFSNPYFALTQKACDHLLKNNPSFFAKMFPRTLVFGRMTPQGKIDVVEVWQRAGRVVGMCGDGGNDCGALRAAHVGVALSESDASVVAPFSSTQRSVMACVEIIKEGRCGIQNCSGVFKFFVVASLLAAFTKLLFVLNTLYQSEWTFPFR